MGLYQIYNGSSWINICECSLNIIGHDGIYREADPRAKDVRYWNGTDWIKIVCDVSCGDSLFVEGGDGAYFIPFTIPSGIETLKVTLSPAGNPDGFSIITTDRTTKLASTGMIGESGTLGWNTGTSLTKDELVFVNGKFEATGGTETITFYGEGTTNSNPGDGPMSDSDGLSMYNPGQSNIPSPLPLPNACSESDIGQSNPNVANRCYELTYTKPDPSVEEDVLIMVVGGNHPGTGFFIFRADCEEPI